MAPLDIGYGTQAMWSIRPSGHLVVFVHGFGGKALTTWSHFASLLSGDPAAAGCDVIFYGYDGLHTRAPISAGRLREFIQRLHDEPSMLPNLTLPSACVRDDTIPYSKITVVAHSLGAVIARQATWDGYRSGEAWASAVRLVLFAPAHAGASLVPLLRQVVPWWPVASVASIAQIFGYFAVAQDLEPGAAALVQLKEAVESGIKDHHWAGLVARLVAHADHDTVVNPVAFCSDDAALIVLRGTHTSICKPNEAFQRPLAEVVRALAW
jgi:triacylglycerol esterase/lipase EstA (alpha/beta hydrolase family)